MREKHYVIVPDYQERLYLAKGYARSEQTAQERLGAAWAELTVSDRKDLVVLEIDADKHAALNDTHPLKWRLTVGGQVTSWSRVGVVKVRELEKLPDGGSWIAHEDFDAPPEVCGQHDLFDSARECVAEKREFILQKIAHLRSCANVLEAFLKNMEAL